MLKILIATHEYPPYPGGVGRYCAEMRDAAQLLGHSVDVLAPFHGAGSGVLSSNGVTRFVGDVFSAKHLPAAAWALRSQLATGRYDVVHIADWPFLLAQPWSGLRQGVKVVMTFHGTDAIVLSRSRLARLLRAHATVSRLTRICANSAFTLALCESELSPDVTVNRRVTHLGVGRYWFESVSAAERREVRALCGARVDDRIILTVARLDERKGHLRALNAIAKLPQPLRETTRYLAIGRAVDPAYARHLRDEANRLGVHAAFPGAQSDAIVRAAYAESHVFLLAAEPSQERVEGFGLVFLEAAAQGLPTVSATTHAVPEVVADGVTGFLAKPGDTDGITRRLVRMLEANATRQFAAACIAHANDFTWLRCAKLTYADL